MKLEISLSATPVLYHFTKMRAASMIVQKNRFELKPSDGTEAEEKMQGRAAYYLSTARHKTASYTKQNLSNSGVIFVLNGIALASKYKIKAVDYWAGMYRDGDKLHNRDRMEAEDRVMSNTPFIEGIDKYITEIHAYADSKMKDAAQQTLAIYRYGKKHKIPVYFYSYGDGSKEYVDSLLLLDKRKAIKFDPVAAFKQKEDTVDRKMGDYDFKYRRNNNEIAGWLQLYEMPVPSDPTDWKKMKAMFSKTERSKMAYQNLGYNHNGDAVRQLSAGMHNEKSTPYGYTSRGREDLDRLIQILRKKRWTIKQFCDHLYSKWYPKVT